MKRYFFIWRDLPKYWVDSQAGDDNSLKFNYCRIDELLAPLMADSIMLLITDEDSNFDAAVETARIHYGIYNVFLNPSRK